MYTSCLCTVKILQLHVYGSYGENTEITLIYGLFVPPIYRSHKKLVGYDRGKNYNILALLALSVRGTDQTVKINIYMLKQLALLK